MDGLHYGRGSEGAEQWNELVVAEHASGINMNQSIHYYVALTAGFVSIQIATIAQTGRIITTYAWITNQDKNRLMYKEIISSHKVKYCTT